MSFFGEWYAPARASYFLRYGFLQNKSIKQIFLIEEKYHEKRPKIQTMEKLNAS
jgi:hypothetical protein